MLRADPELLCGCIAGAAAAAEIEAWLAEAGFAEICDRAKPESRELMRDWAPGRGIEDMIVSAVVEARKPAGAGR